MRGARRRGAGHRGRGADRLAQRLHRRQRHRRALASDPRRARAWLGVVPAEVAARGVRAGGVGADEGRGGRERVQVPEKDGAGAGAGAGGHRRRRPVRARRVRGDTAEGDDPVVERARVRVGGDGGVRQSALSLTKVHFTFVPSKVLRGLLQIRVGEAGDGREESRRFLIKARSSSKAVLAPHAIA